MLKQNSCKVTKILI